MIRVFFGLVLSLWIVGTAKAQIAGDTVRIGVLTDLTSVYSSNTGTGSVLAAQMAIEDFGGTVRGRKIVLLSADHQNKTDIGVGIAREWLDQDHVDAIVDVPTSSIALAVQDLTKKANRVFLISGGGSSDLTNAACSPTGIQWTYDSYGQATVTAQAIVAQGFKTWFFVTADYSFGQALEHDTTVAVERAGGTVIGSVRHPLHNADFSSFLLHAQESKAQVIALANAGEDSATSIKQAAEFGITKSGQKLAALLIDVNDVKSLGLPTAQGLLLASAWYWDQDERSRAFAKRFLARHKTMPGFIHAGIYSAVTNYLAAIEATGTDEAGAVVARMRATPIDDMFTTGGHIRADGRMVHDMYLMRVKSPAESTGEWDLLTKVGTVPGEQAFRPLGESLCPLVKK
jgi:branched-chain amino acid transport system substrate-binding protein